MEIESKGSDCIAFGVSGAAIDLAGLHVAQIAICIKILRQECVDSSTGNGVRCLICRGYFICMAGQTQLSGESAIVTHHDDRASTIGLHNAAKVATGLNVQNTVHDQVCRICCKNCAKHHDKYNG